MFSDTQIHVGLKKLFIVWVEFVGVKTRIYLIWVEQNIIIYFNKIETISITINTFIYSDTAHNNNITIL